MANVTSFLALLVVAFAASFVAGAASGARSSSSLHHNSHHGDHADDQFAAAGDGGSAAKSEKPVPLPATLRQSASIPVPVALGTRFHLAVLGEYSSQVEYLYTDGESVLTTSDPDSVGIERTVWEAVEGYAPRFIDYIGAFGLRNYETGSVLLYNGTFAVVNTDSAPIAGWKLFVGAFTPAVFELVYLPYSKDPVPLGNVFFYNRSVLPAARTGVA